VTVSLELIGSKYCQMAKNCEGNNEASVSEKDEREILFLYEEVSAPIRG
jgi:hypothetical protein